MNSSGESPFQRAALQFALNNSPSGAFKAFLSTAPDQPPSTTTTASLVSPPQLTLPNANNQSLDLSQTITATSSSSGIASMTASDLLKSSHHCAEASTSSSSGSSHSSDSQLSSSTTSSAAVSANFDGIFRVPQLPSLRRFSGCNFCGALTSQQDNGPLLQCDGCRSVLYCSQEHKSFDWKRHKPMCRTFQMRLSRCALGVAPHLQNSNVSMAINGSAAEAMDTSGGPVRPTAIRPPLDRPLHDFLPKSTSASSLHSFGAASSSVLNTSEKSSFASGTKPPQQQQPDQRSLDSAVGESAADADIQIVEQTSASSPRKARKRPLETGGDENLDSKTLKDHSKNLLFKTTLQEHMKSLAASGLAMNQHQAIALRLRYIAEHVIRSLNEYGWAVVDNFLGKTHCKYTYSEIEELYKRGLFKEGQLIDRKEAPDPTPTTAKDIRSDEIYWFDSSQFGARDAVTIRLLVSMIDSVIVHFAKRIPPYTIGGRSRAMIACYPGNGTRYIKHVDNPIRDGRCITSIYYCNDNWVLSEDGGTLRLYPETSKTPMDIDPQADRLVFFWSDHRNPHEVLPVFRHRYAITIWYFDQTEKLEALERQKHQEANGRKSSSPTSASNHHETANKQRLQSLVMRSNLNSAPIPQKPESPRAAPPSPAHGATQIVTSSNPPPSAMQWRQTARIMEDDRRSTSTRSLLDEEDLDENLDKVGGVAGQEMMDHQGPRRGPDGGPYVPNFEV